MIKNVKNYIKTNKYFWQYRQWFDKEVWASYLADSTSSRRDFYSDFVLKKKLKSVFEFGCASGPNLKNIRDNVSHEVYLFGYDINRAALKLARQSLGDYRTHFTNNIEDGELYDSIMSLGIERFDLAIYDRVLYLIDEETVKKHFTITADLVRYIVIDDFHSSIAQETNGVYFSKNYVEILGACGFEIKELNDSKHLVSDNFFKKTAKQLVFRNQR